MEEKLIKKIMTIAIVTMFVGIGFFGMVTKPVQAKNLSDVTFDLDTDYTPNVLVKASQNLKHYSIFMNALEAESNVIVKSGRVFDYSSYDGVILTKGAYPPEEIALIENYVSDGGTVFIIGDKQGGLKNLLQYNDYWLGVGFDAEKLKTTENVDFSVQPLTSGVVDFNVGEGVPITIFGPTNDKTILVDSVISDSNTALLTMTAYDDGVAIVSAGDIIADSVATSNEALLSNIITTVCWKTFYMNGFNAVVDELAGSGAPIDFSVRIWTIDTAGQSEYGQILFTSSEFVGDAILTTDLTKEVDVEARTFSLVEEIDFTMRTTTINDNVERSLTSSSITNIDGKLSQDLVPTEFTEVSSIPDISLTSVSNVGVTYFGEDALVTMDHSIAGPGGSISTTSPPLELSMTSVRGLSFISIGTTIIGMALHWWNVISTQTLWWAIGFECVLIIVGWWTVVALF